MSAKFLNIGPKYFSYNGVVTLTCVSAAALIIVSWPRNAAPSISCPTLSSPLPPSVAFPPTASCSLAACIRLSCIAFCSPLNVISPRSYCACTPIIDSEVFAYASATAAVAAFVPPSIANSLLAALSLIAAAASVPFNLLYSSVWPAS